MNKTIQTFSLVRVNHWVKNLVVFLPLFFSGDLFSAIHTSKFTEVVMLGLAFCFAASTIYILNDFVDIESDKLHPEKSGRPLASGIFSKKQAFFIALFTLAATVFFVSRLGFSARYVIGYFLLNIAYSLWLKKISIVDVTCIGIGFVLRIIGGGIAAGVFVSHWMIIITFLLSISIAFAKRRDDLVISIDGKHDFSRKGYSLAFIDIAKSISFSITLVAYIMYSISESVIERIGSDKLYITSLFVFLGIMRYLQISIVEKKSGSPLTILKSDVFLRISIVLWFLSFSFIIYG